MPVNMRGRTVDANGTVRLISQNFPDAGQANSFASRLISQYGISSTVQQSKNGGFFVVGMTGNTQNIQMYYNQQHDLFVFPDITYAPQINDYVPPAQAAPQAPPAAVRTQNTVQPAVQQIKGKTVVCKKCGATYSKSAKACPSCGAANKKPIYSRWWFWAIIVVVLICLIIPKGDKKAEDISDVNIDSVNNIDNSDGNKEALETESVIPLTDKERIEKVIRDRISDQYTFTDIDSITINDHQGDGHTGEYIALVRLTWNQQNKADTTKTMLTMYSDDLASIVYENEPLVSEIAVFWEVPYLNSNGKRAYVRNTNGMVVSDESWLF